MVNIQSFDIAPGVKYLVHPDHRNGTSNKSQWLISIDGEVDVFVLSHDNSWLFEKSGWGLNLRDNHPIVLGESSDRQRQLFIAKFVDGNANDEWHGYPADHVRRNADIPESTILKEWLARGYLARAKVSKLARGKPCSL